MVVADLKVRAATVCVQTLFGLRQLPVALDIGVQRWNADHLFDSLDLLAEDLVFLLRRCT